jgi:hypothetical protein
VRTLSAHSLNQVKFSREPFDVRGVDPVWVKMPWLCVASLTCRRVLARVTDTKVSLVNDTQVSLVYTAAGTVDLITLFVRRVLLQRLIYHPITGKRLSFECFVIKEWKEI